MFKKTLALAGLLLLANTANAATSYTFGLKVDDVTDYEAFAVGDVRCADNLNTDPLLSNTYAVDDGFGCQAAGFKIVDVEPSAAETFQLGVDSVLLTVDETNGGEAFAGTIKFTLVNPQTYIPISGDLKAGSGERFGDFLFTDLGGGMYEGSFSTCTFDGTTCKAISNIEIVFNEIPVPAAAWLFGSALLGLAGLKRKQS
jgi:hypothetical protein